MFEARYGIFEQWDAPAKKKATFQDVARKFGVTRQGVHAVVSRMLKMRDEAFKQDKPEGFLTLSNALRAQDTHDIVRQLGGVTLKTAAAFYRDVYGLDLPIKQAVTIEPDSLKELRRVIQRLAENNGAASLDDMAKMMKIPVAKVSELIDRAQGDEAELQAQAIDQARSATLDGIKELSSGWYALESSKRLPWRNRFINVAQKMIEGARLAGVQALELDVIIQAVMRVPSSRMHRDEQGETTFSPTLRVKLPRDVARSVLLHYGGGLFLVMDEDECTFVTFDEDRLKQGDIQPSLTDCERRAVEVMRDHDGRIAYKDLHDQLVAEGFGKPLVGKVLQYSVLFRIVDRAVRGFSWDDTFASLS